MSGISRSSSYSICITPPQVSFQQPQGRRYLQQGCWEEDERVCSELIPPTSNSCHEKMIRNKTNVNHVYTQESIIGWKKKSRIEWSTSTCGLLFFLFIAAVSSWLSLFAGTLGNLDGFSGFLDFLTGLASSSSDSSSSSCCSSSEDHKQKLLLQIHAGTYCTKISVSVNNYDDLMTNGDVSTCKTSIPPKMPLFKLSRCISEIQCFDNTACNLKSWLPPKSLNSKP